MLFLKMLSILHYKVFVFVATVVWVSTLLALISIQADETVIKINIMNLIEIHQ